MDNKSGEKDPAAEALLKVYSYLIELGRKSLAEEQASKEKNEMLHLQVTYAGGQSEVRLSHYERLTPAAAIAAREIAAGVAANATVTDPATGVAYRVTGMGAKARARRIKEK